MHYAIGDIQGDLISLKKLLNHLKFNSNSDTLLFLGDVVNRGEQSLETLLFIKKLVDNHQAQMVLGNHDYHLLVCGYTDKKPNKKDTLDTILNHSKKAELLNFLRHQPVLIEWGDYLLSHAGIPPNWDKKIAKQQARLIEAQLQQPIKSLAEFLSNSYQNIAQFSDKNTSFENICYGINALMRMRFCTAYGQLEFAHKGNQNNPPKAYKAWFEHPSKISENIVFGHWSSLQAINQKQHPNIHPLDTGCIWGGKLSALCLENKEIFTVDC